MFVLRAASATACTAVKGGATTISTSFTSLTTSFSSLRKKTASWTVLNIFQLPAMKGIRIYLCSRGPAPARTQRRHAGQRLAREEFEGRAAAGRDVRDAIGDVRLLHRGNRIAAADDGRAFHRRHRAGDRVRPRREDLDLE